MYIYACKLTTHGQLFYASKEVGKNYITMPYIGNYALSFALGLAEERYQGSDKPMYRDQIVVRDVYVYPAKFIKCNWTMSNFNSTGEGYYLHMDKNIVVDAAMYKKYPGEKRPVYNSPQMGQLKLIGPESVALFFIKSERKLSLPRFIRLGKFMTKCEITYRSVDYETAHGTFLQRYPLNPVDLSKEYTLHSFEVVSMKPVPLLENAKLVGEYVQFHLSVDELNLDETVQLATKVSYFSRWTE